MRKKITWFHWAVYRIFRYFWNPILKDHPCMTAGLSIELKRWLELYNEEGCYLDSEWEVVQDILEGKFRPVSYNNKVEMVKK